MKKHHRAKQDQQRRIAWSKAQHDEQVDSYIQCEP